VPTGLLNFGCIQENKRIVTDPTLSTAPKRNLWRETELATYPVNRVNNSAVLGRAEVVNVALAFTPHVGSHCMQDRLDAILHVEVALALVPITQHFEAVGMIQQLPAKIENVSMRVAFAQNRDEAKD
jgi:hypothetical protein